MTTTSIKQYPPTLKDISPLRYPGGKSRLSTFLKQVIAANDLQSPPYYEPYAGGAGAAFKLLTDGIVSELWLNDADPNIYAFWVSVLNEPNRFSDTILSVPLTIEEWKKQKSIYSSPKTYSTFELGFATFYLNRCNRSGIIVGSGPIGGYEQKGKWKINERFNRDNLSRRVLYISEYREVISVHNLEAIAFLKSFLPKGSKRKCSFTYLDPPYFLAGQRLYYSFYKKKEHIQLARYLKMQKVLKWVLTYDDSQLIQKLYSRFNCYYYSLKYSLQNKKVAIELMIKPETLALPESKDSGIMLEEI